LLYKFKAFEFDSPKLMMNVSQREFDVLFRNPDGESAPFQPQYLTYHQYLSEINRLHKDSIRSLELTFYLSDSQPILGPALALSTISSMAGLRALHIHIFVYHSLCDPRNHPLSLCLFLSFAAMCLPISIPSS
jgi:hypothetical protein